MKAGEDIMGEFMECSSVKRLIIFWSQQLVVWKSSVVVLLTEQRAAAFMILRFDIRAQSLLPYNYTFLFPALHVVTSYRHNDSPIAD